MKKIIASSLVMLFVLAGCNTVKGIGEDVSSAGNAVSNTAEKTQDEIRKQLIFASKPYQLIRFFYCYVSHSID